MRTIAIFSEAAVAAAGLNRGNVGRIMFTGVFEGGGWGEEGGGCSVRILRRLCHGKRMQGE